MAFRELFVVEIREVLRLWQKGYGYRRVASLAGVDRKTARRYVEHAQALGLERKPEVEVTDELIGRLVDAIRPGRSGVAGGMRQHCREHRNFIEARLAEGCRSPKLARLLAIHSGVVVPLRTLQRFISEELSPPSPCTVRIVDPPPGRVLEIDFAQLGTYMELDTGYERTLHALVCVAARSRHIFVWPCLAQTREEVIAGLEAAWAFYGGIFPVVVADNLRPVVQHADPVSPRIDPSFRDYVQARDFVLDLTRVRKPQDKGRVERAVRYVRDDFFRGERFDSLDSARSSAARWCREVAGARCHGTTRRAPLEHFESEEQALLAPAPTQPYDPVTWTTASVGRDNVVSVGQALYSVPVGHEGKELRVRLERRTLRLYDGAAFVKLHRRVAPGETEIDPEDLPAEVAELATRSMESLQKRSEAFGEPVTEYVRRLLDDPRPWTRVRQVYRLLGLGKRFGGPLLGEACEQALALDVVDVTRIARMLERGLPTRGDGPPNPPAAPPGRVVPLRFQRAAESYRARPPRPGEDDDQP